MKKTIIILASLLGCIALSAQSQFGVRGGANMANIIKTVVSVPGSKTGIEYNHNISFAGYAGVFGQYDFTDLMGVRAELVYSSNTSVLPSDIQVVMTGSTDKKCHDVIRTLSLPLMATFSARNDKLLFMLGPQLGYNLSETTRTAGGKSSKTVNHGQDYINPFMLSATVGVSYLVGENIGVDFRYSQSLTSVRKDKGLVNRGSQMALQLGLFYNFL